MIDERHVNGIDPGFRYSPEQVAQMLGCSVNLIYVLTARPSGCAGVADARHMQDIRPQYKYRTDQVAGLFNCSTGLIYKLRMCGLLEQSPLRSSYRIPGWSLIDYIAANAGPSNAPLQYVSISKLIRIPGWALIDYITANCSEI